MSFDIGKIIQWAFSMWDTNSRKSTTETVDPSGSYWNIVRVKKKYVKSHYRT